MKFRHTMLLAGVIGVVGGLSWAMSNVSAVINEDIELRGEEFQIAISPAYAEIELTPDKTTSETFRVRNVGSMETDLKIGVGKLEFSGETTMLGTPRNEIMDWTSVVMESGCKATKKDGYLLVHMRVKEECNVTINTKTPKNAPFGEQYMNVFFEEYKEDSADSMQIIRSIGINVFATNKTGANGGEGDMCAKVTDQSVPFWLFEGPLNTTVNIENCGRLNFHATAKIEVYNLFGGLVYEDTQPNDRIIAAETKRIVTDGWDSASIGLYRTKQTVEALGKTYVVEKWTFIIPMWLIVVLLGCLLVVVGAIVYGRKRKQISMRHRRQ